MYGKFNLNNFLFFIIFFYLSERKLQKFTIERQIGILASSLAMGLG
jgi:hypothetical protein